MLPQAGSPSCPTCCSPSSHPSAVSSVLTSFRCSCGRRYYSSPQIPGGHHIDSEPRHCKITLIVWADRLALSAMPTNQFSNWFLMREGGCRQGEGTVDLTVREQLFFFLPCLMSNSSLNVSGCVSALVAVFTPHELKGRVHSWGLNLSQL